MTVRQNLSSVDNCLTMNHLQGDNSRGKGPAGGPLDNCAGNGRGKDGYGDRYQRSQEKDCLSLMTR